VCRFHACSVSYDVDGNEVLKQEQIPARGRHVRPYGIAADAIEKRRNSLRIQVRQATFSNIALTH
jgi:hypothetical protein